MISQSLIGLLIVALLALLTVFYRKILMISYRPLTGKYTHAQICLISYWWANIPNEKSFILNAQAQMTNDYHTPSVMKSLSITCADHQLWITRGSIGNTGYPPSSWGWHPIMPQCLFLEYWISVWYWSANLIGRRCNVVSRMMCTP